MEAVGRRGGSGGAGEVVGIHGREGKGKGEGCSIV